MSNPIKISRVHYTIEQFDTRDNRDEAPAWHPVILYHTTLEGATAQLDKLIKCVSSNSTYRIVKETTMVEVVYTLLR